MPNLAGMHGDARRASDPRNPQGRRARRRRIVSYLWLPTPLEQRGYDWMLDHHVAVNVALGIGFPPYGIYLLVLWATHGYDKDRV